MAAAREKPKSKLSDYDHTFHPLAGIIEITGKGKESLEVTRKLLTQCYGQCKKKFPLNLKDKFDKNLFHVAVTQENPIALSWLFEQNKKEEKPVKVNDLDENGFSAFMYAAGSGPDHERGYGFSPIKGKAVKTQDFQLRLREICKIFVEANISFGE